MERLELDGGMAANIEGSAAIRVKDGVAADIFIRPKNSADISVTLGKGCDVRTYVIMESSPRLNLTIDVGEGSVAHSAYVYFRGAKVSARSLLTGRKAKAYDLHVFIQKDEMELALDSLLQHSARDTEGDILVKGVVAGKAGAALGGLIKIDKGASGAKSHLGEHVMILGENAHASANPRLEIENNEVASRHSASVSRIDGEKLFYLMSRGLARIDAEKLAVEGFLESPLSRIRDEKMRGMFMRLVQNAL
ncbi:MAG: SufD family Fe-S cluster assembly protein [Candidatus Micrarchaeota archaeon]